MLANLHPKQVGMPLIPVRELKLEQITFSLFCRYQCRNALNSRKGIETNDAHTDTVDLRRTSECS